MLLQITVVCKLTPGVQLGPVSQPLREVMHRTKVLAEHVHSQCSCRKKYFLGLRSLGYNLIGGGGVAGFLGC